MRSTIAKAGFGLQHPLSKQTSPKTAPPSSPASSQWWFGAAPACLSLGTNRRVCAAENALKEEAKKPKYSLSLLSIVSTAAQPLKTRLAAALAFKNFIRHNYVVRATDCFSTRFRIVSDSAF
jgi:hypothetical protein